MTFLEFTHWLAIWILNFLAYIAGTGLFLFLLVLYIVWRKESK